jgi:hypothetical protein
MLTDNVSQARLDRREYQNERKRMARASLVAALGSKCFQCSKTYDLFLARKEGAPVFRMTQLPHMGPTRRKQLLPYVQLLCQAHMRVYATPLTHGLYHAAVKKKCTCDECGEFYANWLLERREDYRRKRMAKLSGGTL